MGKPEMSLEVCNKIVRRLTGNLGIEWMGYDHVHPRFGQEHGALLRGSQVKRSLAIPQDNRGMRVKSQYSRRNAGSVCSGSKPGQDRLVTQMYPIERSNCQPDTSKEYLIQ
jgi:hypothetical protein